MIRAADLAFFLAIKVIGRTVKFEIEGWENWEAASRDGQIPIYTFWHDRVFLSTYFWQRRAIVVMTSRSFDGEYIARFIQRFGYGAARGSSSRGATGAVVEMVRLMRAGCPMAFTIDGPRGPRYVAKMGAVLLARRPAIRSCRLPLRRSGFEKLIAGTVPRSRELFTRATVLIAAPILVPPDADEALLDAKRDELQASLDELDRRGPRKILEVDHVRSSTGN